MPVSVMEGSVDAFTRMGTEPSTTVTYPSHDGLPGSSTALTEAEGVAHRPQTVNIQPQSDVVALQNWDMSPTTASIASLLADGPICSLVPQAPDCSSTDMLVWYGGVLLLVVMSMFDLSNSLMEQLDCLNEGIDSVRKVIKTSEAFDGSLVDDVSRGKR